MAMSRSIAGLVSFKRDKREAGLLRVSEVADLVGVSPDTIARWSRSGKMPMGFKVGGESWTYWRAEEVSRWLAARCPQQALSVQGDALPVQPLQSPSDAL